MTKDAQIAHLIEAAENGAKLLTKATDTIAELMSNPNKDVSLKLALMLMGTALLEESIDRIKREQRG